MGEEGATLATIRFKRITSGETGVSFGAVKLADGNATTIPCEGTAGVTFSQGSGVSAVISVTLEGRQSPPNAAWSTPVTVWLHAPGSNWTESEGHGSVYSFQTSTSNQGKIQLNVNSAGFYDIRVKGKTTLKKVVRNMDINGLDEIIIGGLSEGDTNDDNVVEGLDYSTVVMCFGKAVTDGNAPAPDPLV